MSEGVSARLRRQVVDRARDRCEYCRLAQAGQEATFHIDHVLPMSAGGTTEIENLALACVSCSLRKAARRTAIDPSTGHPAGLFNPRTDEWAEHFRWEGPVVIGRSATGRATIDALRINRPLSVAIRDEERARGRHPG